MTRAYRGFEIRLYGTKGDGKLYYEVWNGDFMWGFASKLDDAKNMIDSMLAKGMK